MIDAKTSPIGVHRVTGTTPTPDSAQDAVTSSTESFLSRISTEQDPIRLTRNEYRLLSAFVSNAGKILSAKELRTLAFGPGAPRSAHYVRMYVTLLRRRIEPDMNRPRYILTEYGKGYRLSLSALE